MKQTEASGTAKPKKRGNKLGFWFFNLFLSLFGLSGAYGLLYFVCLYYVLFDFSAVSAALAYLGKRFPGCGFIKGRVHAYYLFINQGKHLIDYYASVSKKVSFDLELVGYEQLMSLVQNSGQGLILLTAHLGNWQIAMPALQKIGKTVYLLMRPEDNQAVQDSLNINREEGQIKIISPEQYLGGVVEIMNVLKEGHLVSIMGDRSYGFKTLEVSFLGEKAEFPYSAFYMAAAAKCAVVVLFSMKVSVHKYLIDVSNVLYPSYQEGEPKLQQLQQWVQRYVALLETYIERYPYQCFLFHNVWKGREG